MKNILPFLLIVGLLISCKSTDSIVAPSDQLSSFESAYDKVLDDENLTVNKIKSFEKTYQRILERDLSEIKHLENEPATIEKWEALYGLTKSIEERQKKLEFILPLKSNDQTYEATFTLLNVEDIIINSGADATDLLFDDAMILLSEARKNKDRSKAQMAYKFLVKLETFNPYFTQLANYKEEALSLGTKNVLVGFDNKSLLDVDVVYNILYSLNLEKSTWINYILVPDESVVIDEILKISVDELNINDEIAEMPESHLGSQLYPIGLGDSNRSLDGTNASFVNSFQGGEIILIPTNNFKVSHDNEIPDTYKFKKAILKGAIVLLTAEDRRVLQSKEIDLSYRFKDMKEGEKLESLILPTSDMMISTLSNDIKVNVESFASISVKSY